MARSRSPKKSGSRPRRKPADPKAARPGELVIITGMSGSGKASVLKAFEDLGYYCVDNLPVGLIPRFAELVVQSSEIERTALVVDVREGMQLDELPDRGEPVRPADVAGRRHRVALQDQEGRLLAAGRHTHGAG